MANHLLNFGDSWAHAADVGHKNGYARIVADSLEYNLQDYSIVSTSIPRMILQFQTFLDHYNPSDNYTALFFVTAVERLTLFENDRPLDIWPQSFGDFYSKWYSDSYGEFVANTSLITLQAMCRSRNIRDVYILGWQNPALWSDVDRRKFLDDANTCVAQQFGGTGTKPLYDLINRRDTTYLIPNNWHPNVAGHKFIAEAVLQHLALGR